MTRWVAVPQRVNNTPQKTFVVPMTAEAAKAQLEYMENANRPQPAESYSEDYSDVVSSALNRANTAMYKALNAKNAYLIGESMTYLIIGILIIMMLLFVK